MTDTILQAALRAAPEPLEAVVLARIRSLLADRRWYRANRWAEWTDLRREGEVELRALVRLVREARRVADAKPDPVTAAKGYDDWTEAELREAHGG